MEGQEMRFYDFLLYICIILICVNSIQAYKIENGNTTHQHITNESKDVWLITPPEIKAHLNNPIIHESSPQNYNDDDDMEVMNIFAASGTATTGSAFQQNQVSSREEVKKDSEFSRLNAACTIINNNISPLITIIH